MKYYIRIQKIKLDHGEPTLPDVFKVKDGDVFLFLKGRDDKVLSYSLAVVHKVNTEE